MPAIEASGLTKVYRTYRKERGLWGSIKGLIKRRYDETRAADQVSFKIEEGEFVGFLGPNGAGKTTVLKMLSGLLNPTSGDARVLGFVPWERRNEMKRQFSLLMGQKNALWWDLPAQESLELRSDQVSFKIEEGEFVGFLGPNGAGKTTVLKMLSGLLNPTSGDARVLGFVPWERRNEMKRQFSLLMGQKNALWWDLPAQESLEL